MTEQRRTDLLTVDGVDFSYGSLQVLFDVSLHVGQGEALALLGTNGAGKSTLLKVIAGLVEPSAGTITMNGEDVTRVPAEAMSERGFVLISGGRACFADMTVEENLEIQGLAVRKRRGRFQQRREVVYATFPRLKERRTQLAGSMSGGEQQQLAVARALLLEPSLLCIDELSLGLAPLIVQDLMAIVEAIHDAGVTVVLVEQSLNIAAALCERAIFMEKGEIRFEGRTEELLERDDIARAVFLGSASE